MLRLQIFLTPPPPKKKARFLFSGNEKNDGRFESLRKLEMWPCEDSFKLQSCFVMNLDVFHWPFLSFTISMGQLLWKKTSLQCAYSYRVYGCLVCNTVFTCILYLFDFIYFYQHFKKVYIYVYTCVILFCLPCDDWCCLKVNIQVKGIVMIW